MKVRVLLALVAALVSLAVVGAIVLLVWNTERWPILAGAAAAVAVVFILVALERRG